MKNSIYDENRKGTVMNKKLKVAQIGIEHDHGSETLASMKRLAEDFEVVAYAETGFVAQTEYNKAQLAALEGIPKVTVEEALAMDDLDAIAVEPHDTLLSKYAQMVADKGIHLHVDKPCATDYPSMKKLIDTVKAKNIVFHTGYMYRFNPMVNKTLEMVKNGELGEIFSVEAHMDCEHVPSKREWLNGVPGGMMMFLGCHLVDLIKMFHGYTKDVTCLSTSTHLENVHSKDYGFALFKYDNGLSFAKTCAREIGGFDRRQLVVCGSKGTVEIKPLERYTNIGMQSYMSYVTDSMTKGQWKDCKMNVDSAPYDRYDGMMHNFAQKIRGEITDMFTPDYEMELYEMVAKACGIFEN